MVKSLNPGKRAGVEPDGTLMLKTIQLIPTIRTDAERVRVRYL